jgi:hypothetical protein
MNAVRDLAIEEIAKTWSLSAFSDSELSRHENGLNGSRAVTLFTFAFSMMIENRDHRYLDDFESR